MSTPINRDTIEAIIALLADEGAKDVTKHAAAAFLKTTFSKVYNVSFPLKIST